MGLQGLAESKEIQFLLGKESVVKEVIKGLLASKGIQGLQGLLPQP